METKRMLEKTNFNNVTKALGEYHSGKPYTDKREKEVIKSLMLIRNALIELEMYRKALYTIPNKDYDLG